jgi:hypothetical protein
MQCSCRGQTIFVKLCILLLKLGFSHLFSNFFGYEFQPTAKKPAVRLKFKVISRMTAPAIGKIIPAEGSLIIVAGRTTLSARRRKMHRGGDHSDLFSAPRPGSDRVAVRAGHSPVIPVGEFKLKCPGHIPRLIGSSRLMTTTAKIHIAIRTFGLWLMALKTIRMSVSS